MSDTAIKKAAREEKQDVDTLSSLYEQGKKSKAKIKHDKVYNFLVVLFASIITVCIGVIVAYLIYVNA